MTSSMKHINQLPNIKIELFQPKPVSTNLPNNSLRKIFLALIICNIILAIYSLQSELASLFSSNFREFLSLVVIVCSGLLGAQAALLCGQDSMLGMLAAGVFMRNIFPSLILDIPHAWTSVLWTLALCSVISRAGLSLQKEKVLPHLREALMLGILPVLTEAFALSTMARLFFGLPTPWAFTLAFGVSSISPGVVVPLILRLLDNGWQKSRLPPLLLTALGIDVLVGTSGFGISLASSFGHSHEHQEDIFHDSWVARGAEELMVGVSLGALFGLLSQAHLRVKVPDFVSTMAMYLCSTACMIWCKTSGFTGAASCATFITWSTIANTWSRGDVDRADQRLKMVWLYFKPFLFPVIGSTISLTSIPLSHIIFSLCIVACSMAVKMGAAYWTGRVAGLDKAESLFVCGLWTGKASIQATLCSAALEMVHRHGFDDQSPEHKYAKIVFLCMVCSIVLGVPSASTWVKSHGKVPVGLRDGTMSLASPSAASLLGTDGDKEMV